VMEVKELTVLTNDTELPTIVLPIRFNYIAVFLTFACTLRCGYCINHHGGNLKKKRWMSGKQWIRGLNRLTTQPDLPITLQGGEPSVHKDFYRIVQGIKPELNIDLLTNLEVDAGVFRDNIPDDRLKRKSPYASIRVSYHHGQSNFDNLLCKVMRLKKAGYSIGIWEVDHPDYHGEVIARQQHAASLGIDYRLKEFLGPLHGKVYGTMRYNNAVNDHQLRNCFCKTTELLIDPAGDVYRCHSDLYAGRLPIGSILDPTFGGTQLGQWAPCAVQGTCSSCDIKIKTNRFQKYGHSSVEIKDVTGPYSKNLDYQQEVVNTYGKLDMASKNV